MTRGETTLICAAGTVWVSTALSQLVELRSSVPLAGLGLACLFGSKRGRPWRVWIALALTSYALGAQSLAARTVPAEGRFRGILTRCVELKDGWDLTLRSQRGTHQGVFVRRRDDPALDSWPEGFGTGARIEGVASSGRVGSVSSLTLHEPASTLRIGLHTLARWPQTAQRSLIGAWDDQRSDEATGLLLAMSLGDRQAVPSGLRLSLESSGLAHFAVMSGLHVGLLSWLVALPFVVTFGRGHRSVRWACLVIGSILFVTFVDAPPIRRAALGFLAYHAAFLCGRRVRGGASLAGLLVALLLTIPSWSLSVSLLLSVLAVTSILCAARSSLGEGRVRRSVFISSAPFLGCWAPLVFMTGHTSIYGAVFSIVYAPLFGLALTLTYASLVLAWTPLGAWLGRGGLEVAEGLVTLIHASAGVRGAGALAADVGPTWVALHLCATTSWLSRPRLATAFVVLATTLWPLRPMQPVDLLSLVDVGQGQAVLFSSEGRSLLIDVGDGRRRHHASIVAPLRRSGSRKIDHVLITHADVDHRGGLLRLLHATQVGEILVPENILDATSMTGALTLASRHGVPTRTVRAGQSIQVGRAEVRFHHPRSWSRRMSNEQSVVATLRSPDVSVLLPGDADQSSESEWLDDLDASYDILVASHHGSNDATSTNLLRRARPGSVLISCGKDNRHGHPHPELLARVSAFTREIWITANDGTWTWSHPESEVATRPRCESGSVRNRATESNR